MTSYEFEAANRQLFIEIANRFETALAIVEYRSIFDSETKKFTRTQSPEVRSGVYGGVEGFYFRASGREFNVSQEVIRALFPMNIDGFEIRFETYSDAEYEEDRIYPASVGFSIFKDGTNVLETFAETVARVAG
jgi:hypothetical protein